jgi:predicted signal transduction protein with EAL and GGDEF domain
MVRPIREVIEQLNRVRQDRHQLRSPLMLSGNAEVRELVQVFNDMSADLARLYDEYEEAAFIDQLTALPNRALFLDRLRQMILLSERKGEKFGVMLLDLDSFKEINDTLGHQVGDKLLQQIAERLRRTIRASSTIARVVDDSISAEYESAAVRNSELTLARLGGDEFAILLPNLKGIEGAISVAKRITEVLEPNAEIDGNTIVVAGTLGIAMFPEHGEGAEALLRRADIALYVAKHIQSDFSIYDPAYDTHSVKQLALKAELRAAIEGEQMVLFYQPKLDFKNGCVMSVEALIRWQHPQRGMIPPDQFIPLSEQRGLIGPLTEWVIKKALWQYNQWQQQGIHLQIAVNLSSRVLYDLSLPNKVERLLVAAKLPPSALSFEITEEATMVDPQRALDIMNRLNEMACMLAIDDFGTGYSSLGYLKRLPVAEIKIDRSFVMDMEASENDAKIVHATIDLAHNLGLKVVAEGVETEYALNMLNRLNCDYAQGYYLSRPIPADELIKWLAESAWSCKTE